MVPPLAFLRSFLAFSQARRVTMCLDQGRDLSGTALEWAMEAAEEQEIYAVKYIAVLVPILRQHPFLRLSDQLYDFVRGFV